jgi:hypothetical protein
MCGNLCQGPSGDITRTFMNATRTQAAVTANAEKNRGEIKTIKQTISFSTPRRLRCFYFLCWLEKMDDGWSILYWSKFIFFVSCWADEFDQELQTRAATSSFLLPPVHEGNHLLRKVQRSWTSGMNDDSFETSGWIICTTDNFTFTYLSQIFSSSERTKKSNYETGVLKTTHLKETTKSRL